MGGGGSEVCLFPDITGHMVILGEGHAYWGGGGGGSALTWLIR